MGGIPGEVVEFEGVFPQIVEFLSRSGRGKEDAFLHRIEFAGRVQRAQPLQDFLRVLVIGRLQQRAVRIEIADVFVAVRPHGANTVDRLPAPVARGEDRLPRTVVGRQNILCLHPGRHRQTRQSEGGGGDVDVFDGIVAHHALGQTRAAHDQGRADPFVIDELFAPGMTDPVVTQQKDIGLIQKALLLEVRENAPDFQIRDPQGVEILRMVAQQHRIPRVVGRQADGFGIQQLSENPARLGLMPLRVVAIFAPPKLQLAEERLSFVTSGPIPGRLVEHGPVPSEIVIRLGG